MLPHKTLCAGCGASLDSPRKYCTRSCGRKQWRRAKAQELHNEPRPCKNPSCKNTLKGDRRKKFCSSSCHKQKVWTRAVVDRRTALNIQSSPPCTICGETTARAGFHLPPTDRIPKGVELCVKHLRGLYSFTKLNGLEHCKVDDVFNAYLVSKTFTGSHRVPYLRMMREALGGHHSREGLTGRPATGLADALSRECPSCGASPSSWCINIQHRDQLSAFTHPVRSKTGKVKWKYSEQGGTNA